MFTEEEITEIIKQKIETDEKLGDQSGGSATWDLAVIRLPILELSRFPQTFLKFLIVIQ